MTALSWRERQGAVAVELARRAEHLIALADLLVVLGRRSETLGRLAVRLLCAADRLTELSHHRARCAAPPAPAEQSQSAEQLFPRAA